jgi:hypothetical protein
MTKVTWASAIKNQPDCLKKLTKIIGPIAFIISDPSFDAITCLCNLGNEPDPIIIFPSAINQRPIVAIHNFVDLGSTRNTDLIPFAIADSGSSHVAVTFNPQAIFRKMANPLSSVPAN